MLYFILPKTTSPTITSVLGVGGLSSPDTKFVGDFPTPLGSMSAFLCDIGHILYEEFYLYINKFNIQLAHD